MNGLRIEDWKTALGWGIEFDWDVSTTGKASSLGRRLGNKSREIGVDVMKTPHHNFGEVNVYHRSAAEALANEEAALLV